MDSRTVKKILDRVPKVSIKEIDSAITWLVAQQRAMLADSKWDQTAYERSNEAIDYLLDARLDQMPAVG